MRHFRGSTTGKYLRFLNLSAMPSRSVEGGRRDASRRPYVKGIRRDLRIMVMSGKFGVGLDSLELFPGPSKKGLATPADPLDLMEPTDGVEPPTR